MGSICFSILLGLYHIFLALSRRGSNEFSRLKRTLHIGDYVMHFLTRCSSFESVYIEHFPVLGSHSRRRLSILSPRTHEVKHSDMYSNVSQHLIIFSGQLFLQTNDIELPQRSGKGLCTSVSEERFLSSIGILTSLANIFSAVFSVKNVNLLTNSDWTSWIWSVH